MINSEVFVERIENAMSVIGRKLCMSGHLGLQGLDVTVAQLHVLKIVNDRGCCKMSEISNSLKVTMGNITSMVDRLIKQNLVKRYSDPKDRRVVNISLTKKGENMVKKIHQHRSKAFLPIIENISEKDMSTLLKILENIAVSINNEKERE